MMIFCYQNVVFFGGKTKLKRDIMLVFKVNEDNDQMLNCASKIIPPNMKEKQEEKKQQKERGKENLRSKVDELLLSNISYT